jgi:F-type H+-transporting ATPase subunit b
MHATSRTEATRWPACWRPATALAGTLVLAGALAMGACEVRLGASADPQEHAAADAGHGEASHGESWGSVISRVANFAILAAGLWYFLRSPLGRYLEERAEQIREGLVNAARMKAEASDHLARIGERMQALPAELDMLKSRGALEIKGEEERIRHAAELERQRLLEQMRREIDLQLQAARRDLTRHAAQLAVRVAERRVNSEINEADQQRLIGRYVSQVKAGHE